MDDVTVKFEIWDTAGQERYHSLAPMYYRGAQVYSPSFVPLSNNPLTPVVMGHDHFWVQRQGFARYSFLMPVILTLVFWLDTFVSGCHCGL